MYASELFTDTEMYDWEREDNRLWATAQANFIALYKKKRVYNEQFTNRRSGVDSANSIAEQTAASNHFSQTPPCNKTTQPLTPSQSSQLQQAC